MTFATKTRRAAILSNLLFSLPLAAGLLASAIPASAQTNLDVTVPFAFSVGNQHLPAGHYRVQSQSQSNYFLSIRNVETAGTTVVMVRSEAGRHLQGNSRLVFNREGNQNYLTQVWAPETDRYSELPSRPRHDQELRTQVHPAPSTVEVAAK
jgi:hypothetical protein